MYDEIDGTEMEASANIFDLRFVPDGMEFPTYELTYAEVGKDDGWRDEATERSEGGATIGAAASGGGGKTGRNGTYKGVDFKTDALRHSKVKLTWDADDPERAKVTRNRSRASGGEVLDDDFKAYLASDQSDVEESADEEAEEDAEEEAKANSKGRERLRALLNLSDGDKAYDSKGGKRAGAGGGAFGGRKGRSKEAEEEGEREMEITFTPGLSEAAARRSEKEKRSAEGEETTLEKYKRKEREKKAAKREARLAREGGGGDPTEAPSTKAAAQQEEDLGFDDPFFNDDDGAEIDFDAALAAERSGRGASGSSAKEKQKKSSKKEKLAPKAISAEERAQLEALVDNDTAAAANGLGHFDMKDVLKAEEAASSGGKKKKPNRFEKRREKKLAAQGLPGAGELRETAAQEGFRIDAADARFAALYEDHRYALDPSHKSFVKSKAMDELMRAKQERLAREEAEGAGAGGKGNRKRKQGAKEGEREAEGSSLLALAQKLKNKQPGQQQQTGGKRQKV